MQSNGVACLCKALCIKQSRNLKTYRSNVIVDDRALYEIYLPPFKAAVQDGDSWTIMGAYDLYKGQYATHNQYLINDILKGEWGYKGVVISDWGATADTKTSYF